MKTALVIDVVMRTESGNPLSLSLSPVPTNAVALTAGTAPSPLSPYALFLQRNAAQAALLLGESLHLQSPVGTVPAPVHVPAPVAVPRNAMLMTYEEEEAEYIEKHGTTWAPRSPVVFFADAVDVAEGPGPGLFLYPHAQR